MCYQLYIGYYTEWSTDIRFLESIIDKTFQRIAYESRQNIEINVHSIIFNKNGLSFTEQAIAASKQWLSDYGISILCIHADADMGNLTRTYSNKINPAIAALRLEDPSSHCMNIVPIIPIQETEAWMIADKNLFKKQIGTVLSDSALWIDRSVESMASPKEVVKNAIRLAMENRTKRRRKDLSIDDLYSQIWQTIDLDMLRTLKSYQDFENKIREILTHIGLL